MKILPIAALCSAAFMLGCAAQSGGTMPERRYVVELLQPFDAAQATRQMAAGTALVKGSGFLRQSGGGVVTCAGSKVVLIPATEYASERVRYIYGSRESGMAKDWRHTFNPDYAVYTALTKSTTCDAQGNFQFERVADGDFYATTVVHWFVSGRSQGGMLMRRFTVKDGSADPVVVTQ